MKKIALSIFFIVFIFGADRLFAQELVLDNNPSSVKWEYISTPHFKVIYPTNFSKGAQHTANLLEQAYVPVSVGLLVKPRPISVILQNQGAISNGFVTYSPRRAEFFAPFPQSPDLMGNLDWMQQLSIHEFRHVAQFTKSMTGFNNLVYLMFGPSTATGMAHLALPSWYWEGDAVVTETALTKSGRGSIPQFGLGMKMNLLERGGFGYHKQTLGSFRDFVPDHYVTGYYYAGFLRTRFGNEILERTVQNSSAWSFVPFTFSYHLGQNTGKNLSNNYKDMKLFLKEYWEGQTKDTDESQIERLKSDDYVYTNYQFPTLTEDKSIIALKSGLKDFAHFVIIGNNGGEKELFVPGPIEPSYISYSHGKLVWCEYEFDPRWAMRNYTVVKLYDTKAGKLTRLTPKQRYKTAAISPDGSKIAAVNLQPNGSVQLDILDASTGQLIKNLLSSDGGVYYLAPYWASNDEVVAIEQGNSIKKIISVSTATGAKSDLYDAGSTNIHYPKRYGKWLFFNSPYSGIDNIFVKDLDNGQVYRVTNAKYGAYNPEFDPESQLLYFNIYGRNGYGIGQLAFDEKDLVPISNVEVHELPFVKEVRGQEGETLSAPEEHTYPTQKYRKTMGLINPYSWGFGLSSSSSSGSDISIQAVSQDVLSNTQIAAGYSYNTSEQTSSWEASISCQAWYPIIDLGYSINERNISDNVGSDLYSFNWKEKTTELGFRLPLNLTRSKYYQQLSLGAKGAISRIDTFTYALVDPTKYQLSGTLRSLGLSANYGIMHKRAKRDTYSKLGVKTSLNFLGTPFGGDFQGSLASAEFTFFLPGLFRHHSLRLRGAAQEQVITNYSFQSPVQFPRGYLYRNYNRLFIGGANYAFNLAYPDISIGPLVQIQRIWLDLWVDVAHGRRASIYPVLYKDERLKSLGADLMFDINLLRQLPLFSVGIRGFYIPDENKYGLNLILANISY